MFAICVCVIYILQNCLNDQNKYAVVGCFLDDRLVLFLHKINANVHTLHLSP